MGMLSLRKRELLADNYLPFVRHADDQTVITTSRGAFRVLRLDGAAFLTADNKTINVLHERLANALRQVADDNVMIYSHVVRREDTPPMTPMRDAINVRRTVRHPRKRLQIAP